MKSCVVIIGIFITYCGSYAMTQQNIVYLVEKPNFTIYYDNCFSATRIIIDKKSDLYSYSVTRRQPMGEHSICCEHSILKVLPEPKSVFDILAARYKQQQK